MTKTHEHSAHPGSTSPALDNTIDELRTLILEAEQAMANAGDDADEKLLEIKERLKSTLEEGKSAFGRWRHVAIGQAKRADETVRAHPYESIGIAVAVGALIGFLLSSSRR